MTAKEYKNYKGLRKENLRDNMTDLEVMLADIGEITTRELTNVHKPFGLEENRKMASVGGQIASNTRKDIESKLGKSIITKENALNYQYKEQEKIESK